MPHCPVSPCSHCPPQARHCAPGAPSVPACPGAFTHFWGGTGEGPPSHQYVRGSSPGPLQKFTPQVNSDPWNPPEA